MMLFLRYLFLLAVFSTPAIAQVTCDWSLKINQSEASGLVTPGNFTVTDSQGSSCDLVQFSQKCPGPSGFEINGGHSDLEFIVLVLYNVRSAAKAYFGASDDALNYHADIPVQIKSAYPASSMD
ncbi:putative AA1-like domain-containing protein [Seiridium cardinale]|uniref:AA1-like domain-containing protein n=1 Tax=Seiridium cardinale TaxID=138064 RepID=A0ABR2X9R4_9PEZI